MGGNKATSKKRCCREANKCGGRTPALPAPGPGSTLSFYRCCYSGAGTQILFARRVFVV